MTPAFKDGGCNSKLGFHDLTKLLHQSRLSGCGPSFEDAPSLTASPDLVTAIDCIAPFTADRRLYGAASAAHVITDIHAVGGTPKDANISFVIERNCPFDVASQVMHGLSETFCAHGLVLRKGHTMWGTSTLLTISLVGEQRERQPTAKTGENYTLVLTKPLGAFRGYVFGTEIDQALQERCTPSLVKTHAAAVETLSRCIEGTSDVTGFGIVGTAAILRMKGFSAVIDSSAIRLIDEEIMAVPSTCDTAKNYESFQSLVRISSSVSAVKVTALCSSQVNGPILALCPRHLTKQFLSEFHAAGFVDAHDIGSACLGGNEMVEII